MNNKKSKTSISTSVSDLVKSKKTKIKTSVSDLIKSKKRYLYPCFCIRCDGAEVNFRTQENHTKEKKTDSSQPNNNENIHILFSSSLLLPNPSYFHVPALDENKDNNEYIYYNEEEENDDDEDDGNEDDGDKNDDDENDGDENDGDENNSDEKKKKLFPEYIFYENFCVIIFFKK
ncbi:hypothetical protein GLOIN_2v1625072 [Rhizophagus irregularis DAOM 181602=DAOM 197198]|nr:hypothetical protein GLOIN_2v1625072 [Rhizophagus irregularis DAOM 181602=DAOM 197198]